MEMCGCVRRHYGALLGHEDVGRRGQHLRRAKKERRREGDEAKRGKQRRTKRRSLRSSAGKSTEVSKLYSCLLFEVLLVGVPFQVPASTVSESL